MPSICLLLQAVHACWVDGGLHFPLAPQLFFGLLCKEAFSHGVEQCIAQALVGPDSALGAWILMVMFSMWIMGCFRCGENKTRRDCSERGVELSPNWRYAPSLLGAGVHTEIPKAWRSLPACSESVYSLPCLPCLALPRLALPCLPSLALPSPAMPRQACLALPSLAPPSRALPAWPRLAPPSRALPAWPRHA